MSAIDEDEMPKDGEWAEESEVGLVKNRLTSLAADFRHLALAEMNYWKVRAAYSGRVAKRVSLFAALALFFAFSFVVALMLGLLLIAAAYLGPIIATVIIVLAAGAMTAISAFHARNYARKLLMDGDDDEDGAGE